MREEQRRRQAWATPTFGEGWRASARCGRRIRYVVQGDRLIVSSTACGRRSACALHCATPSFFSLGGKHQHEQALRYWHASRWLRTLLNLVNRSRHAATHT